MNTRIRQLQKHVLDLKSYTAAEMYSWFNESVTVLNNEFQFTFLLLMISSEKKSNKETDL